MSRTATLLTFAVAIWTGPTLVAQEAPEAPLAVALGDLVELFDRQAMRFIDTGNDVFMLQHLDTAEARCDSFFSKSRGTMVLACRGGTKKARQRRLAVRHELLNPVEFLGLLTLFPWIQ